MGRPRIWTEAQRRERQRRADQERSRRVVQAGRDIGTIPAIKNPKRRERCRKNLCKFLRTYHADTFELPFSPDQLQYIARTQTIILHGGCAAIAMPRGGGKTSISELAAEWAILYGHRKYVQIVAATDALAVGILDDLKTALETNELLAADFPEVVFPVLALERIAHRCKGQSYNGVPTRIEWTSDTIVVATIPESAASGSTIRCVGITGAIRGPKRMLASGKIIRPDLVICDDPQTRESAKSLEQTKDRIAIVRGDIMGLAGPRRKIAFVMPCTVIKTNDLADQLLDRQKHPEMQGQRTKMVNSWCDKESPGFSLWGQYAEIRREGLRTEKGTADALKFYKEHRKEMDAGFEVTWKERFDKESNEISAQQHAMNLRIDLGDSAFFAEYNNSPIDDVVDQVKLTVDLVESKINRRPRYSVALNCQKLVGFIDVQHEFLAYGIMAVEKNFTGYLIDYGTWPDQRRRVFARRDPPFPLSEMFPQIGLEARIHSALTKLLDEICGRVYLRDDSAHMRIDRLLVDANDGKLTNAIYEFCRTSKYASVIMPSHGKYIGGGTMPMANWPKKAGELAGDNWVQAGATKHRFLRHIIIDVNFWKSFLVSRILTRLGDPGCLSLYGDNPGHHQLLAEHCTAEYAVPVYGRGRKVEEWQQKPEKPDNEFWDVLTGCCVAASHVGCRLDTKVLDRPITTPKAKVQREAIYL